MDVFCIQNVLFPAKNVQKNPHCFLISIVVSLCHRMSVTLLYLLAASSMWDVIIFVVFLNSRHFLETLTTFLAC